MNVSSFSQTNTALDRTNDLLVRNPKTSMDQKDFLQLLTVQLTHQDPMNPQQDTAFVAQMASFTSLEQMNNLVEAFEKFNSDQGWTKTIGYVGQNVDLLHEGNKISGVVEEATKDDGKPMIRVGGVLYPVSEITAVRAINNQPATTGETNP